MQQLKVYGYRFFDASCHSEISLAKRGAVEPERQWDCIVRLELNVAEALADAGLVVANKSNEVDRAAVLKVCVDLLVTYICHQSLIS